MDTTPEVIEATNKLIDAATVKPTPKQIMVVYTLLGLLAGLISIGTLVIIPPLGLIILTLFVSLFVYFLNKEIGKRIRAEEDKRLKKIEEHQAAWERSEAEVAKVRAEWHKADTMYEVNPLENTIFKKSRKRTSSTSTLDNASEISDIIEYAKKKVEEEKRRPVNSYFIEDSPSIVFDCGLSGSKIKRRIRVKGGTISSYSKSCFNGSDSVSNSESSSSSESSDSSKETLD